MALVEWVPISKGLQELAAMCRHCRTFKPLSESVEWQNVLACTYCYVCIDCLSEPEVEAHYRAYGWMRA